MDFFIPPKELIDKIATPDSMTSTYRIIPPFKNLRDTDQMLSAIDMGIIGEIEDYYRFDSVVIRKEKVKIDINKQEISQVVLEGLRNAVIHGSKNLVPVMYGTFYGTNGVCHGFQDGGKYFTRESTKNIFENKTPIKIFGEEVEGLSGTHVGTLEIYESSDAIFVDTMQNVLFCVQYRDRLISPR
jgi:hypothetical protein